MQRPTDVDAVVADAHAPLAGAGNLSELAGRAFEWDRPLVSADLMPRPDMRHCAGSRRREFVEACGCLVCGAGNAGFGGIGVGFFGAGWPYGGSAETYWNMARMGDPRRMGICEAWAAVYGLRDVGLRTLQFFVNCQIAADAHGDPPVQAYRNPGAGLGWRGAGHDGV